MDEDYYVQIGLPSYADKVEIRNRIFRLRNELRNSGNCSAQKVQNLAKIEKVLTNDEKREEYDCSLNQKNYEEFIKANSALKISIGLDGKEVADKKRKDLADLYEEYSLISRLREMYEDETIDRTVKEHVGKKLLPIFIKFQDFEPLIKMVRVQNMRNHSFSNKIAEEAIRIAVSKNSLEGLSMLTNQTNWEIAEMALIALRQLEIKLRNENNHNECVEIIRQIEKRLGIGNDEKIVLYWDRSGKSERASKPRERILA